MVGAAPTTQFIQDQLAAESDGEQPDIRPCWYFNGAAEAHSWQLTLGAACHRDLKTFDEIRTNQVSVA